MGCCFGHQLLGRALGGRVTKNPSGRFVLAVEGIQLIPEAMQAAGLLDALQQQQEQDKQQQQQENQQHKQQQDQQQRQAAGLSGADGSAGTGGTEAAAAASAPSDAAGAQGPCGHPGTIQLRLLESHGDQLVELPPGATLLASSPTAVHEMFTWGGTVLAFQFHPEMDCTLAYEKILPAVSKSGRLSAEESAASEDSLLKGSACGGTDAPAFIALIQRFIDQGVQERRERAAGSVPAAQQPSEGLQQQQDLPPAARPAPHQAESPPSTAAGLQLPASRPAGSLSGDSAAGSSPLPPSSRTQSPAPPGAEAALAARAERSERAALLQEKLAQLLSHLQSGFDAGNIAARLPKSSKGGPTQPASQPSRCNFSTPVDRIPLWLWDRLAAAVAAEPFGFRCGCAACSPRRTF